MADDSRIARLRVLLADSGHAAMFVSDLVNVRYLTGFTGSNGALLVPLEHDPVFLTDGRYRDQAAAELEAAGLGDVEIVVTRDLIGVAAGRAPADLVAETHLIDVDSWEKLGRPEASGRLVERLREVKDDTEIAALRRACEISCAALEALLVGQLAGRAEREVARDLEWRMLELGAEDRAFDTILAAGENSAIPHHQPTDRELRVGDLVKIDFGARVDGYHADCTRTVVIGPAADWQREIHAAVRESQAAGLDRLRPGVPVAESNAAARDSLERAGWLEAFTTGLGHGVGLQIHEDPFIAAAHPGRLASRTVLTMEPGIYLPGRGGVRIEDTVLVTDPDHGGEPDVLTDITKELLEID
ncbi:M24 family metallopeptidase [Aeromicrobium duanguangcaii]|uniref:Xaa-Pro peptidase family protein n=1 Tax=Aeromicrobium duanguangcaii TaxID=2968086 RepID=A0ABY5KJ95_9ACTN|nr:Xaa-Pro peptidase family protein [Aeromicrobium duanguangcaii]MCD9153052.1 Xaa-Pro peptidase family protein [Aeromicrobium duanguangcaii]UUI69843.1 Xaa-Pro peptidase family protein [Aeromicrobium duanguangcaii]